MFIVERSNTISWCFYLRCPPAYKVRRNIFCIIIETISMQTLHQQHLTTSITQGLKATYKIHTNRRHTIFLTKNRRSSSCLPLDSLPRMKYKSKTSCQNPESISTSAASCSSTNVFPIKFECFFTIDSNSLLTYRYFISSFPSRRVCLVIKHQTKI